MKRTYWLCGCIVLALLAAACSPHTGVSFDAGAAGKSFPYMVGYGRALDEKTGHKGIPFAWPEGEAVSKDDPEYKQGWSDAMAGVPMK